MNKKRVLVLDGGGAKGVMQSVILREIEERTGKQICEIFDLIVGTSVGAILGGIYASGKISADSCHTLMKEDLKAIFKKRFFKMPKYSRKPLTNTFNREIGEGFLMGHCKTPFVCTAVNMVDGRTHYFKSWERRDSRIKLIDAVNRSSAAPLYFGSIKDEISRAVWLDGGVGNANNPILEAVVEVMRQEWLESNHVHILNIGTGYHECEMSFKEASKSKTLKQLSFFMDPSNGGLARNQSVLSRATQVDAMSKEIDNLSYQRIDTLISEKLDTLDGVKFIHEYEQIGISMAADLDWKYLTDEPVKGIPNFALSSGFQNAMLRGVTHAG